MSATASTQHRADDDGDDEKDRVSLRDEKTLSLKDRLGFIVDVFKDSAERFSDNQGFRLVASFSYYATFSIFPLLLLAMTVVGFVVGDNEPAKERLLAAIAGPGSPVREVLAQSLTAMQESSSGRGISAIIGFGSLLFAASGAFVELDEALNRIWCEPLPKTSGILASIKEFLRERLTGFAIVASLGVTLLLSLGSSALLSNFADAAKAQIDIPLWPGFVKTAEVVLSLTILSFVFTMLFHFIPRSRPKFRVVVGGAILTTILLSALKEIFATYLAHLTSYSAYGIAGGMLALGTWIYLSAVIIFFGAQLTRVRAEKIGAVKVCSAEDQFRSGWATTEANKIPAR